MQEGEIIYNIHILVYAGCVMYPLFILQWFACNGTVVNHPEYGEVIQLQGDQRNNMCDFLIKVGLVRKEQLKVHGF